MKTKDIKEKVTNKIIEQLEKGKIPWNKPWYSSSSLNVPVSRLTGKPYRGINRMLLDAGEYLTFKQIKQLKGKLNKGAKSEIIVYWNMIKVEDENTGEEKQIPYLKYFNVFNIKDTDIEPKYDMRVEYEELEDDKIEEIENIFESYLNKYEIEYQEVEGNRAYYSTGIDTDIITLPLKEQFKSIEEYYGTKAHEFVHSTGHDKRLKRDMSGRFGTKSYAKEELVAEIGKSIFLSYFNLDNNLTDKSTVAYCQSWIQKLKNDANLIISASTKSQKAVDMIIDKES